MKKIIFLFSAFAFLGVCNNVNAGDGVMKGTTSPRINSTGRTTYDCPTSEQVCNVTTINKDGTRSTVTFLYDKEGHLIGTKIFGQSYEEPQTPENGYNNYIQTIYGIQIMKEITP